MTKLITSEFRTHIADQFIESFDESANTIYYMFAARSLPYENEALVPDPGADLVSRFYDIYKEMVFGKKILSPDVCSMIRNITWTTGTVYDIYDDTDANLESKNFYVTVYENDSYYNVFKCLDNVGGAPSTQAPSLDDTDAEDEFYKTGDGYQWKYMFSVPVSSYNKFAANGFMPIVVDANVVSNAANGAIETILVENSGINYNSYASGRFKEAAVSGNTLAYSLSGEKYRDIELSINTDATGNTFSDYVNEKVTAIDATSGAVARGIVVEIDTSANKLRLTRVRGNFLAGQTLVGDSSNTHGVILSKTRLTEDLSANTDFYKNSSVYVTTGDAAGQVRTITEYSVTGDDRTIYVDTAFDPLPDANDEFDITPRVLIEGDGTGAVAIANVDETSNAISSVDIVQRGENYSFADVTILANTGLQDTEGGLLTANTASVRAVMSPPGGHGSDVKKELFATRVGIGTEFANNEGNSIVVANDYRKFGIIKDPLFANTVLTVSTTTAFEAGQTLTQENGATATISARNVDGDTTLRITSIRGTFVVGEEVTSSNTSNSSIATANVTGVDSSVTTFEQLYKYNVTIIDNGDGTGFSEDDLVTQQETDATGIVYAVETSNGATTISLTNVKGHFSISDSAAGTTKTFRNNVGAEAELTGEVFPDLLENSGDIIYLENTSAITRADDQTEKIKLILEF